MQTQFGKVKQTLYAPLQPIALDYIFHNNERDSIEKYNETLRKNELRVKFKNAIMQHWTKMKEETSVGSLQDMIDQMLKRKRASKKDGLDYQKQEDKKEELKAKMEQKKQRKNASPANLKDTSGKAHQLNLDIFPQQDVVDYQTEQVREGEGLAQDLHQK